MKAWFGRCCAVLGLILVSIVADAGNSSSTEASSLVGQAGLEFLKGLKGHWVVQGGDEGPVAWEFDVTSRGNVVVERLKVGTATEMATVYYLDGGSLMAAHYCQLQNQPRLAAVIATTGEDLHFLCDGDVGNTQSHSELHMHGVHFQKQGNGVRIWMDMSRDGETAFETSYELVRTESK